MSGERRRRLFLWPFDLWSGRRGLWVLTHSESQSQSQLQVVVTDYNADASVDSDHQQDLNNKSNRTSSNNSDHHPPSPMAASSDSKQAAADATAATAENNKETSTIRLQNIRSLPEYNAMSNTLTSSSNAARATPTSPTAAGEFDQEREK